MQLKQKKATKQKKKSKSNIPTQIKQNLVVETKNTDEADKIVDVNMDMHYAGFWVRVLAAFLDFIIIFVPAFAINLFLVYVKISELIYLIDIGILVLIIYLVGSRGATPGKMMLGLIIVNEKKEFIGFANAALRYVGEILCGLTLGIGYLMIAFDMKKQGMHDKIAKTYVIYRK